MEIIDEKAAQEIHKEASPEGMVKELVCPDCGLEMFYGRKKWGYQIG